jgi:hypothetical protein
VRYRHPGYSGGDSSLNLVKIKNGGFLNHVIDRNAVVALPDLKI